MPTSGLKWVCKGDIFVFQVEALYDKRRQKLRERQDDLLMLAGLTTDTHLRGEIDAYFAWIETAGQTATLRELEGVMIAIFELVRPLFC